MQFDAASELRHDRHEGIWMKTHSLARSARSWWTARGDRCTLWLLLLRLALGSALPSRYGRTLGSMFRGLRARSREGNPWARSYSVGRQLDAENN